MSTVFYASCLSSSKNPCNLNRKWDGRSVISSQWVLSAPATAKDQQIAEEAPRSDVLPAGWDVRYTALYDRAHGRIPMGCLVLARPPPGPSPSPAGAEASHSVYDVWQSAFRSTRPGSAPV